MSLPWRKLMFHLPAITNCKQLLGWGGILCLFPFSAFGFCLAQVCEAHTQLSQSFSSHWSVPWRVGKTLFVVLTDLSTFLPRRSMNLERTSVIKTRHSGLSPSESPSLHAVQLYVSVNSCRKGLLWGGISESLVNGYSTPSLGLLYSYVYLFIALFISE